MRVLVVHNRYASALPSGENTVVDHEVQMLREAGVTTETYFRSSDEIATMSASERVRALASPVFGTSSRARFRDTFQRFKPDLVHLHNPYPLISPHVIDVCADNHVPVVATIHNYRLRCINGLFYRDGAICTECEDRSVPIPGIRHACYRGSRTQSAAMAAALVANRSRWDRVALFIAVSEFVAERLRGWGVPADRVVVKPNAVPDPGPPTEPTEPGDGFLFAGRLSEEKGIVLLLDAWAASGLDGQVPLYIAGDGPLMPVVRRVAASRRSIIVVGSLDRDALLALRLRTAVSVIPSLCLETQSAAPESLAAGRPVIATACGGLPGVVDESVGWIVSPDEHGLAAGFRAATDQAEVVLRAQRARLRYEARYEPGVVISQLLAAYEQARKDA